MTTLTSPGTFNVVEGGLDIGPGNRVLVADTSTHSIKSFYLSGAMRRNPNPLARNERCCNRAPARPHLRVQ